MPDQLELLALAETRCKGESLPNCAASPDNYTSAGVAEIRLRELRPSFPGKACDGSSMTSCINSGKKALEVRCCSAFNPDFSLNHASPIRAILSCLFVGGHLLCATYYAEADVPGRGAQSNGTEAETTTPCPPYVTKDSPDEAVDATARLLVERLKLDDAVERDRAAAALQAMGTNAANALARHIERYVQTGADIAGTTTAITILAKIGTDVVDNDEVTKALLCAAETNGSDWSVLQLRLAAIDAIGQVNKYRGAQFTGDDDDSIENLNPRLALVTCEALETIADDLLMEQLSRKSSSEAPVPNPRDGTFYKYISFLHDLQGKLLELAAQASAASSSSKGAEPKFTKLTDAKTLAACLKKVVTAYSDATTAKNLKDGKPDNASDKMPWQFQTESAYDLVTETSQLSNDLNVLTDFADARTDLTELVSTLATIGNKSPNLDPTIASALNAIFSTPPEKKPAEGAKKEAKTDEEKKDGGKKDGGTAKDGDKAKTKN